MDNISIDAMELNFVPVKTTVSIGDTVYYRSYEGATPERGVVTSFCDDENFIFVRFKGPNGERTPVGKLSL